MKALLLLAYRHGLGQGPINLGSGHGVSIRELVETIVAVSGRPRPIEWDATRPVGEPSATTWASQ